MDITYDLESITPLTVANTTGEGRGNAGGIALRNFCIAIDSTMYVKTGELLLRNIESKFGVPVKYLIITITMEITYSELNHLKIYAS